MPPERECLMALDPIDRSSAGGNYPGVPQPPTPEEQINEHFHNVEHHLRDTDKKNGFPNWDRKRHVYEAIDEYNDATKVYNSEAKSPRGVSETLQQIDWEGYRQRIFRILTKVPGISQLKTPSAKIVEDTCYILKDKAKPGEMVCIKLEGNNFEKVECQPGQKREEEPNKELQFCYPERWDPNSLLTKKPKGK